MEEKSKLGLDYKKIVNELNTEEGKHYFGLEIILNIKLDIGPDHLGYFPLKCLDSYDPEQRKVILASDYSIWQRSDSIPFFFRSIVPGRPLIFVPKSDISSIRRLSDDKVLYSE